MAKHKLFVEYDYDFFLAGISCHEKPYRLCWAINQAMEMNLEQKDPLMISVKKNSEATPFPLFSEEDSYNDSGIYLIGNKSENQLLIPEQEQADYFFIARGAFTKSDREKMLREMKNIPFVLMSFNIDPESLKSKQNLVF